MKDFQGKITQIIGPVIDVTFPDAEGADFALPPIHDALLVKRGNGHELIMEVQQHTGERTVRCVAMDTTDGLSRAYL